jgi:hypothetical protein
MLRIFRQFAFWSLLLAAIVLLGLARNGSSSFQKCISEKTAHQGSETEEKRSSHTFMSLVQSAPTAWRCTGVFLDENNPTITALATVAIAAFTIVLAIVTNRQARFTRESIELARDEFNATHRPRITVRGFQTLTGGLADEDVSVIFLYVNTGDSDAIVTEIGTKIISGAKLRLGFLSTELKSLESS